MDFKAESIYNNLKLPQFLLFFTFIYIVAHKIFKNWGPKHRYDACSCVLSLFHGTPSVILAIFALIIVKTRNPDNPTTVFASKNTPFQNLVLEFSTSYFIMDLLHYLVFNPHDVIFIAHHLATLFALLTCRFVVNHGASAILGILILAEVTSPLQNIWSLASLRKTDFPSAKKVFDVLSPGFYAFYTVVRGVLAPLFVIKIGFVYASGAVNSVIPTWVWCSWMMLTVSGIFASLLWILNHWIVFYKEKQCNKKLE
ncbi:TLC domain-containing protein At5g14285-like [Amaranthus tricolor]|uniref:TLC domain-containing protein At5g14285-like n=1 Tax=Amaranthus tricolor TaxID=29722 RepID=UPI00258FE11C|nr:TLC domain-containing protein At5g14285-like [Amaranthus tricolor]